MYISDVRSLMILPTLDQLHVLYQESRTSQFATNAPDVVDVGDARGRHNSAQHLTSERLRPNCTTSEFRRYELYPNQPRFDNP